MTPHVAAALRLSPADYVLPLVRGELSKAVAVLYDALTDDERAELPEVAECYGAIEVMHYLGRAACFDKTATPDKRAAGEKVLMCIQVMEREGQVMRDKQRAAARHKRASRESDLMEPIREALRASPDSTWKEILTRLVSGGEVVTAWDDGTVSYWGRGDEEKTITEKSFSNLVTKAKLPKK